MSCFLREQVKKKAVGVQRERRRLREVIACMKVEVNKENWGPEGGRGTLSGCQHHGNTNILMLIQHAIVLQNVGPEGLF